MPRASGTANFGRRRSSPYIARVSLDPSTLLFGFAILLAALIGGYLLGHAASGGEPRRSDDATEPATELRRALRRVEQENEELTLYFVSLPDLIRQLHGNKDKRAIGPLLLNLLDILFEPNQILIFYRSAGGDTFKLTTSKGLPRGIDEERVEIRPGEGRLGWVADHQVTMDARDFGSTSMFRGDAAAVGGRFIVDLCVPLVDPEDNTTLGVMSVGGLTRYPRNEKKMIKMAADLGALAIKNAEYHQRIRTLANEDSLTRLFNKRFGADQLGLAINLVEQQNKNLSVFLFDIDNFKVLQRLQRPPRRRRGPAAHRPDRQGGDPRRRLRRPLWRRGIPHRLPRRRQGRGDDRRREGPAPDRGVPLPVRRTAARRAGHDQRRRGDVPHRLAPVDRASPAGGRGPVPRQARWPQSHRRLCDALPVGRAGARGAGGVDPRLSQGTANTRRAAPSLPSASRTRITAACVPTGRSVSLSL